MSLTCKLVLKSFSSAFGASRLQSVLQRFLTTEPNFTPDFSFPLAVKQSSIKQFLRSVRNIIISLSFPLKVVSSWPQRGVLIASM